MKKIIFLIFLFSNTYSFAQQIELIPYRSQNVWGYATSNRQIAITPEYDSVSFFNTYGDSKNVFAYVFKQNKVGLIDVTGKLVIPFYAKNIEIFTIDGIGYCNRILVNVANKYGIVDFKNQIVIPFQYDTIIPKARYVETPFGPEFSKEYDFYTKKANQYFSINSKGIAKSISKAEYDKKVGTSFAMMPVVALENWVSEQNNIPTFDKIIAKNKNKIDGISNQSYGVEYKYYKVYLNHKVGVVLESELERDTIKTMISPQYDTLLDVNYGYDNEVKYFLFSKDSKITILSPDGKIILPLLYNSYESWDSWSIITKENGKLGYFGYKEGIDIKPKYDFIKRYRNVWYVTLDGKSYYINKYGFKYCSD